MDRRYLEKRIGKLTGKIGFYYKNLVNSEIITFNSEEKFLAASLVKVPILGVVQRLIWEGEFSGEDKLLIKDSEKMPSCGALLSFEGDLEVDIDTLCRLMITLSDNTATNALVRFVGIERINGEFEKTGLLETRFNRYLFDEESGLENYVCPEEIGKLLEQIYRRKFVSAEVSKKMEDMLLLQQIRHKIPGYIGRKKKIANKTGESGNTTHDGAIVYAKDPFILVICADDTNVPETEIFMREISLEFYRENGGE